MSQSINPTSVPLIEEDLEQIKKPKVPEKEEKEEKEEPAPRIVKVRKPKIVPFWTEDPNIIMTNKYVFEFFPVETMSFNQKLNAITRTVVILTLITFLFTQKSKILIVSLVSLLCIFFMHYAYKDKFREGNQGLQDSDGLVKLYNRRGPEVPLREEAPELFQPPTPKNPMSNVLVTDYDYNPNKKPALPAYTKEARKSILEETKKTIQLMHPDQPNIDEKLFKDANDCLELEQSMRQFYSTPNTTIPNDQTSFAEFCYGDMISNKEGNIFAATRNNPRFNLY